MQVKLFPERGQNHDPRRGLRPTGRRVRPNVVAEVERMITALNLVAAGAGITVVPASMRGVHSRAVSYRPLARSVRLNAPLTLAYRAADAIGAVATFVELVTALAAESRSGSSIR
jgi:DNA-binding transcriptional LysR family regulator